MTEPKPTIPIKGPAPSKKVVRSVQRNLGKLPIKKVKTMPHLESLFEPWMTWDNYGPYKKAGGRTWQLDHIIPQSALPYDSMNHCNFGKCWALENLRPLDSLENIRKSNK
jgi:hypothetical protein